VILKGNLYIFAGGYVLLPAQIVCLRDRGRGVSFLYDRLQQLDFDLAIVAFRQLIKHHYAYIGSLVVLDRDLVLHRLRAGFLQEALGFFEGNAWRISNLDRVVRTQEEGELFLREHRLDRGCGDKVAVHEHVNVASQQWISLRRIPDARLEIGVSGERRDDRVGKLGLQLKQPDSNFVRFAIRKDCRSARNGEAGADRALLHRGRHHFQTTG